MYLTVCSPNALYYKCTKMKFNGSSFISNAEKPGPEVTKLFSCSTQLSMKFFLLSNVNMPTIVDILTFLSGKNSILGLSEPKKAEFLDILILMSI